MNIELLNICYKFFNRFIIADKLVEMLSSMDNKTKETEEMVKDIKAILEKHPNSEDEYVRKEREKNNRLIERLRSASVNDEFKEIFEKRINGLKEANEKEIDSHERWMAVINYIIDNDYFNDNYDGLSDSELLDFITQYIQAPFPPKISQEKFDKLTKFGIENDEREKLWRLAFNYEGKNINFNDIVDYYIKVKDGYYLSELISAVGYDLDIDSIIDKIDDKELIKGLIDRKPAMGSHISEEQLKKLESKL